MLAARNQQAHGRGGRGGGRVGRGFVQRTGSSQGSNKPSNNKEQDNKKLKKFHPQMRGKTPEFSFDEVRKELIKAVELASLDKAEDTINSVREMELIDLDAIRPVRVISEAATRELRQAEQETNNDQYKYELKKWDARVDAISNNKRKLHAKVLKFCSEAMEEKLERESDYEELLYDDPIALLKRIKKFMTTSEDTDWEMFELWETLKRLLNCHQGGQESPNAFRKCLEENAKGVQALLGNTFLYDFAETTQGYQLLTDVDERDLYKNNVWEMLLASGMMFNSLHHAIVRDTSLESML